MLAGHPVYLRDSMQQRQETLLHRGTRFSAIPSGQGVGSMARHRRIGLVGRGRISVGLCPFGVVGTEVIA